MLRSGVSPQYSGANAGHMRSHRHSIYFLYFLVVLTSFTESSSTTLALLESFCMPAATPLSSDYKCSTDSAAYIFRDLRTDCLTLSSPPRSNHAKGSRPLRQQRNSNAAQHSHRHRHPLHRGKCLERHFLPRVRSWFVCVGRTLALG